MTSLADLRALAEQAREPLCDERFRSRLLRQALSTDEMEQYVDVVETERAKVAAALDRLVEVAQAVIGLDAATAASAEAWNVVRSLGLAASNAEIAAAYATDSAYAAARERKRSALAALAADQEQT